jgi:hypothetical protein
MQTTAKALQDQGFVVYEQEPLHFQLPSAGDSVCIGK